MCFSAKASFLVSAILLPMGAGAIQLSRARGCPRSLPLAVVPVLFNLQQVCEGFVWLAIQKAEPLSAAATSSFGMIAALIYLFFAYAFWPVWIPWSAVSLLPKTGITASSLVRAIPLLGLVPGVLLWVPLLSDPRLAMPVQVSHGLVYRLHPWSAHLLPPLVGPALYATLLGLPLLLVPSLRVRVFALTLLLSFAVSAWAYSQSLTSIWCFASALLSAQIVWILLEKTPLSHLDPAAFEPFSD